MPQPKTSVINFNTPVMLALSTANNEQIIAIESTGQTKFWLAPNWRLFLNHNKAGNKEADNC